MLISLGVTKGDIGRPARAIPHQNLAFLTKVGLFYRLHSLSLVENPRLI